ncbi:MAG: aldehyde ferredoxin oxidoreductase N-terminal domain-containing protein [Pseudomonadota bacterium]
MDRGGFSGKILYVDLTQGEIKTEPLDMDLAEKFVGGLGLAVKLAYDHITPGIDPLDPENPLVLGAGPLVGTGLPASSRVYAVSKLLSSGTVGWCGAGGVTFGCNLKNSGLDHIVIRGRSERPVCLIIDDDRIEIRPAGHLWGKSVDETYQALAGDPARPFGVLSIGQAGERLCTFSMAFINRIATLGRGGFGAQMGSKNLKAVAVRGSGGVSVADRGAYKVLAEGLMKRIREYPYLKVWQELGLLNSFPNIDRELYHRIKVRRLACVSCPSGCKDVVRIPDGEFAGFVAYSSSVINLWTPVIYGFKDYRQAIRLIAELDAYGLDMFEFFGLMGFVKALVQNGLIPKSEVEPEIALDSYASMMAWAGKIAYRQGLGDVLAGGFNKIIETFGQEARPYAPALIKGMHPYTGPDAATPWDLFGTMELGQVLDPRGPHVGAGGSPTYFAKRPLEVFPKHLARMGVPDEAMARIMPREGPEGQGLKIGRLLKYSHNWFSILGCLGVCARAQINRFYSARLCADLYQAVTGIETDLDSLRRRVDRVWTLLRLANLREGFDRAKEEALPGQWFSAPGFKNYLTEQPLRPEEAEGMIEDYYQEWGWDRKTGAPSQGTLKELGLP